MKQKRNAFTVESVTRHRNGVCGRPFYVVAFVYLNEGQPVNLTAIMPDAETAGECFVTDPKDPTSCWRGDHFFADVKRAIDAQVGNNFSALIQEVRSTHNTVTKRR